ncbi:hypothetical protein NIES2104_10540 [Leptolyngbya sp. NIES-2104]|nr:hypothetical protein NIES2104_10540 [Leptolyngbya sp. NIES-2104]
MYRDGIGFRAIERATGISHNTIINWVKQSESESNDAAEIEDHPDESVQPSATTNDSNQTY